jgi:hypothetical protein
MAQIILSAKSVHPPTLLLRLFSSISSGFGGSGSVLLVVVAAIHSTIRTLETQTVSNGLKLNTFSQNTPFCIHLIHLLTWECKFDGILSCLLLFANCIPDGCHPSLLFPE